MPSYPAARLLVTASTAALPDDFQVIESRLRNGLPHFIDLDRSQRLKLVLPTGLLRPWLDADPAAVVASSADETAPLPAATGKPADPCARAPLRVAALLDTEVATVPVSLRARHLLSNRGSTQGGTVLELAFVEWEIHAGTVCGGGDFGSYLRLAWRRADRAVNVFGPPVINSFLWHRLVPSLRVESKLGLRQVQLDARFLIRRNPING
jgi:hypothetical protein